MLNTNILETKKEGAIKVLTEAFPSKKALIDSVVKNKAYPKERKDQFEFICLLCNHFNDCNTHGTIALYGCVDFEME